MIIFFIVEIIALDQVGRVLGEKIWFWCDWIRALINITKWENISNPPFASYLTCDSTIPVGNNFH